MPKCLFYYLFAIFTLLNAIRMKSIRKIEWEDKGSFHSFSFLLFGLVFFNLFDFLDFFDVHFILSLFEAEVLKKLIGLIHGFVLLFTEFLLWLFLEFFSFDSFEMIVVSFLYALIVLSWHSIYWGNWVVDKIIIKAIWSIALINSRR